jgi:hypothetical protein
MQGLKGLGKIGRSRNITPTSSGSITPTGDLTPKATNNVELFDFDNSNPFRDS